MSDLPGTAGALLSQAFELNFQERGEIGASVAVWQGGREVFSLAGGLTEREGPQPWTAETLVPVWSATKGPAAVTCLLALEAAGLDLSTPVAELWPAFAEGGKERVQFAHVLSHTAGLFALDQPASSLDYASVIRALERQPLPFPAGTRQGYHARTFGFLLDEIVRRATGAASLGAYFRQRIGDPMALEFWIGLPAEQEHRVATLYPGKMRAGSPISAFMKAFNDRESPTRRAFQSPGDLHAIHEMNSPKTWALGLPAMGGIGTARALAQFYAMLAGGGQWQGRTLVSASLLQALQKALSQAEDLVLCTEMAFSAGMMKDPSDASGHKLRRTLGPSPSAFGHAGAGGSLAFADPDRGLGFAYVMNQMELGVLPNEKALSLVQALEG